MLGLRWVGGPWTESKDGTLRNLYEGSVSAVRAALPRRSGMSIRKRAGRLGISTPVTPWSRKEDEPLSRRYAEGARRVREALPRRTLHAIHGRAKLLGLSSTPGRRPRRG